MRRKSHGWVSRFPDQLLFHARQEQRAARPHLQPALRRRVWRIAPPAGVNTSRPSTLPVQEIRSAITAANLGLLAHVDTISGGGRFLSEFIAYHGVWYQSLHSDPNDPFYSVAAGHIHVGGGVSTAIARQALDITLRELITHVDSVLSVPEPSLSVWCIVCLALSLVRGRIRGYTAA